MKSVADAGDRVAKKFAAVGRRQTCVQETGCQICQKGEVHHPPYDSPGLGGRKLKGLEKIFVSGVRGSGRDPPPPG